MSDFETSPELQPDKARPDEADRSLEATGSNPPEFAADPVRGQDQIPHSIVPSTSEQMDVESPDSVTTASERKWWHSSLLVLLATCLVGYMIVLPLVQEWLKSLKEPTAISVIEEMTLAEAIQLRVMQGATGLWFLVLGGTIGSFLNVVAYRMPRGQSVVFNPSCCPGCGNKIQARDNLPVIGWLALGGHCRNCGMSISARYPIVEGLVAIVFFLFFFFQLLSGSANVPGREPPAYAGIVWIIFYTKWEHILFYLYHCLLASVLFTWALIDFDGNRIRWNSMLVVLCLLLVPSLIWPYLHSVPADSTARFLVGPTLVQSLLVGVVGAMVGWMCGATAVWMLGDRGHAASGLTWVGLGLGWQAAIAVLLLAMFFRLLAWLPARWFGWGTIPLTHYILLAFILHHPIWRWTIDHCSPYWPSSKATTVGWIVVVTFGLCLVILQAGLYRSADKPSDELASC